MGADVLRLYFSIHCLATAFCSDNFRCDFLLNMSASPESKLVFFFSCLDMPQSYIFRMVAMDFRRVVSEAAMDIDANIRGGLTSEECSRLTRVKSSLYKYSGFQDTLPPDEMNEKIQEEARRSQV